MSLSHTFSQWSKNKTFIDIRLRPGMATPSMAVAARCSLHLSASRPLPPNVTSIKPEVHNIAQRRQRRTEPRPRGISTQNFVKIGPAVSEICSLTDRHTDRRVDDDTPHPYGARVTRRQGSYSCTGRQATTAPAVGRKQVIPCAARLIWLENAYSPPL